MIDGRTSWTNPRVLTILTLVFVAGAFTGALSMRLGLHERLHPAGAGWSKANQAELLDRCKKDLDLTPEQAREMASVLDDWATYYQSLQDQLADVKASGKTRILQILNEQQKQKFERMLVELQNSRKSGQ